MGIVLGFAIVYRLLSAEDDDLASLDRTDLVAALLPRTAYALVFDSSPCGDRSSRLPGMRGCGGSTALPPASLVVTAAAGDSRSGGSPPAAGIARWPATTGGRKSGRVVQTPSSVDTNSLRKVRRKFCTLENHRAVRDAGCFHQQHDS